MAKRAGSGRVIDRLELTGLTVRRGGRRLFSGLNLKLMTLSVCPFSVSATWPVAASHSFEV